MTADKPFIPSAGPPGYSENRNEADRIERARREWTVTTDSLRQLVLLMDADGRVLRANRTMESWGLGKVESAPGRSFHDLLHPACSHQECWLQGSWDQAVSALEQGTSVHFCVSDPHLRRILDVELRPIASPREETNSFAVAVFEDISGRKQADDSLRVSQEKFSKAFLHSPAAMSISRRDDGLFFEINDAFEQLTGFRREEALGRTSLDLGLWDNPPDRQSVVEMLNSEGAARNREFRFRRRNGDLLVCRYSAEVVVINETPCVLSTIIDLTERKWAEDALRREKAFSDAVLDSVPGLLYLFDEQGQMVGWNRRMEEISGYQADELGRRAILEWFPEEHDKEVIRKALARVMESGYAEAEAQIQIKSGARLLQFLTGVRLEIGGKRYMVGVGTDITERKRNEEELRRSRNMLVNILDSVPMSVFWKDLQGVYRGCNRVFCRQVGRPDPEAIVGLTDFDLPWPPRDAETYRTDDQKVISSKRPWRRFVEPLQQADGTRIWADVTKVPLIDESGAVSGILGLHEDITERVRAADQIRRMTAELKIIYQSQTDQFLKLDHDGTILGLPIGRGDEAAGFIARAMGKKIAEVFPPAVADTIRQAIEQVQRTQSQVRIAYQSPLQGEMQMYEAQFMPLLDNQVFVVNRNVTEQVRLESIAQSVALMNNIGSIFSGIRHEIGNPINSIKMTVSVLKNQIDRYSKPMILEYVDRVLSEIGRVEYLLKALKNFNMFESLMPKPTAIGAFLDDFLPLIHEDFGRRGIEVVPEIDPLAGQARFDSRALHQVLLNLVSNAAEALDGVASPRIVIRVVRRKERLEIAVQDNGCGMSTSQQKNLFRPFFTSKPTGTGLGLIIVKKLLNQMDGTIDVDSREAGGTIVRITLPL